MRSSYEPSQLDWSTSIQYPRLPVGAETMARLGIGIVMIVGIASLMCISAQEELYPDKYDYIDVNNILNNEKLRNQHRRCYMGLEPCVTADMKFYKEVIGEALVTNCKRCTEKQKENLETITEWYLKNQPEQWEEFVQKMISDLKMKNGGQ